ncbi:FlgB family protein [Tateyamaria omphalii]|uniref:FlgB family protein n=1 Tax=Tateyamaria omphalii TaxID=299262 RepID=UPI001C9976C7|nr:FlgB family protein [Tateyamaria omphalii]MBY5933619.1 FlgB family protein [Tateyamaria omphalii]
MFQKLAIFETAHAMSVHAGQKQAVIAQNIANADTPGYVSRDIPSFAATYAPGSADAFGQRATRSGHMHGSMRGDLTAIAQEDKSFAAPDGNSVSIETEMLRATDAKRQHDRSLAIYKSSLTILRASLGRQ